MKFHLLNRYANLGRYGKYTLFVLALFIFSLGARYASGVSAQKTSTPRKSFRLAEAITKSADGKTITAKQGFELVKQGENKIVARKKEANVMSEDTAECTCVIFPPCGPNSSSPCCSHPRTANGAHTERTRCQGTIDGFTASCRGNCDRCQWR